jgi:hypothetical protein
MFLFTVSRVASAPTLLASQVPMVRATTLMCRQKCVSFKRIVLENSGGPAWLLRNLILGEVSSMSAVIHRPDTLNHGDQITCTSLHLTYVIKCT